MHQGPVGIELGSGVTGIVGELLDEELIGHAKLVFGNFCDAQGHPGVVLDEITQN